MTMLVKGRARSHGANAEAAEKRHADAGYNDIPGNIPADEETGGATSALETPVAPPEMAKERDEPNK